MHVNFYRDLIPDCKSHNNICHNMHILNVGKLLVSCHILYADVQPNSDVLRHVLISCSIRSETLTILFN